MQGDRDDEIVHSNLYTNPARLRAKSKLSSSLTVVIDSMVSSVQ